MAFRPQLFAILICSLSLRSVFSYDRPPPRRTLFVPNNGGSSSPQQVHISLVGNDKMRISWITDHDTPATVRYGTSPGVYGSSSNGTTSSYRYIFYRSGQIHEAVIGPLMASTTYYYKCGDDSNPELTFKTPPSKLPIKFAVVGDLGQTGWTTSTLDHVAKSDYEVLLLPGDLSYADRKQARWDSFGRLVENLASKRPWMVTQGNHELEKIPIIHRKSFTAYNARWHMPFEESGSDSNLYYSFDVAGVHVIMLASYADFNTESAQYEWLVADLKKIDRSKTPWLVVIVHAPWYNTNEAHQRESEAVDMKASMESLIYKARADVVFAGHVHAYERFTRVYQEKVDKCGPTYITIGDGGNHEGLAKKYKNPKPNISLFREASFGHGQLEVVNSTHAFWSWHRNDDDISVNADSVWLENLSGDPSCKV